MSTKYVYVMQLTGTVGIVLRVKLKSYVKHPFVQLSPKMRCKMVALNFHGVHFLLFLTYCFSAVMTTTDGGLFRAASQAVSIRLHEKF